MTIPQVAPLTCSVLVVDDEPSLRKVLRTSLSACGFTVDEARSGEEALGAAQNHAFDLVLLDINMPGIGGVETCRRIRVARSYWDAHNNRACRGEREKALGLYESLNDVEREKVPQVLQVWLRYRSEKYFGEGRTPPGSKRR